MKNKIADPTEQDIQAKALTLLALREHSQYDLKRKLCIRYGQDNAIIDRVIQDVQRDNLQNDQRFTEALIYKNIQRGYGMLKIKHELKKHNIDEQLMDNCQLLNDINWQERAEAARAKKFGDAQPSDYKQKTKQCRFLYQRGFPVDIIEQLF